MHWRIWRINKPKFKSRYTKLSYVWLAIINIRKITA